MTIHIAKKEGYKYLIYAWKQFESIQTGINYFQAFFDLNAHTFILFYFLFFFVIKRNSFCNCYN